MSGRRHRLVTAVVVDRDGNLHGALAPRRVSPPWWHEVAAIVDAFPGATVLRLLEATPDPDGPMGGAATYLVEMDDVDGLDLQPWDGTIDDQPLRMPWARPGGPEHDHRWVASQVTVIGRPRQHRTWNLSAIWSYPTEAGTVWLKCVPAFFAHEAAVLRLLDGEAVPRLLAAEGHRLLLADMGGHDGYDATEAEQRMMLDALVDLQVLASGRVGEFLDAGVPDLRAAPLTAALAELVERLAPAGDRRHGPLAALVGELPDRLALAESSGPPPTLVHGDAHGGNCRLGAGRPRWFDWGDSFIASPLFDLPGDRDGSSGIRRHWLARWSELAPAADEALAAMVPVAQLRQALVYQGFCDRIEPAEHVYHRRDVPAALDATIALL